MVQDLVINQWNKNYSAYPFNMQILNDLIKRYNEGGRYYHTLDHILTLLLLIDEHKELLKNANLLKIAAFFHDAIYDPNKTDNEKRSAQLAREKLTMMEFEENKIKMVESLIISTQNHVLDQEVDSFEGNFFLDCDLAIFSANQEKYKEYNQQIRKEYSMYPDFLYNKGRVKVLKHFLQLDRIYKTDLFYIKREQLARQNINRELQLLMR